MNKDELWLNKNSHLFFLKIKHGLKNAFSSLKTKGGNNMSYESLYNNAPSCYYSIDENGVFIQINDTGLNWLGYSKKDVVGRMQVTDFFNTKGKALFQKIFPKFLKEGYIENLDFDLIHKNGSVKHMLMTATLTEDKQGNKISHFVLHDITEKFKLRNHNEQLTNRIHRAKKLDVIGRLTTGLAHEINNMLMCILGYSELNQMFHDEIQDQQVKEHLKNNISKIETTVKRCSELIDGMLLCYPQNKISKAIVIKPTYQIIMDIIRTDLTNNKFYIQLELDDTIIIQIGVEELRKILLNLLVNAQDAIKYNKRGIIKIKLSKNVIVEPLYCSSCLMPMQGNLIELNISDNGSGISPETMEYIFDPFFTTKTVDNGKGLGLAIVNGIIHNFKGHIVVSSQPNVETNVKLFIQK